MAITRAVGSSDESTFRYSYDAAGRRVASTDPLAHSTTVEYDGAGRLIRTTDPLGAQTTFAYDEASQLGSSTDPNGHVAKSGLGDRLRHPVPSAARDNRLTSVGGVTYTWDNNGNLLNDGL